MNAQKTDYLWRLIPLLIMMLLASALAFGIFKGGPEVDSRIGEPIPDFNISAISTKPMLFAPDIWRHKVAVVNFFASWCESCQLEHPVLMKLAGAGKVAIYGVAWKDKAAPVVKWLTDKAQKGMGVSELADTGAYEPFRVRWVLVDSRAESVWRALPRDMQRKLRALVAGDKEPFFSTSDSDRLEDIGIKDGVVFHLYAIEDEEHYPPPCAAPP